MHNTRQRYPPGIGNGRGGGLIQENPNFKQSKRGFHQPQQYVQRIAAQQHTQQQQWMRRPSASTVIANGPNNNANYAEKSIEPDKVDSNVPRVIPDMSKVEPLDGTNYRRWSQRMTILFEALEVDYVLFSDPPTQKDTDDALATPTTTPVLAAAKKGDEAVKEKYERDNKTVRGHILQHMNNKLFDMFFSVESSKNIWDTLRNKYGSDEARRKKYAVGNLLRFQMVDDKQVMNQVYNYELLVAEVLGEGMKICETFQANMLIEKFPPSWSDFRNHLKHKKRDLTLPELISHMRIEEANRLKDNRVPYASGSMSANIVKSAAGVDKFKGKGKRTQKECQLKSQPNFNKGDTRIQKKQFTCYVCGKMGHKAYQCFKRKGPQT